MITDTALKNKDKLIKAVEAFRIYEKLDDELQDECETLIKPILDQAPISEEQKIKAVKIIKDFYKLSKNKDGDIVLLGYDLLMAKVTQALTHAVETKQENTAKSRNNKTEKFKINGEECHITECENAYKDYFYVTFSNGHSGMIMGMRHLPTPPSHRATTLHIIRTNTGSARTYANRLMCWLGNFN